MASILTLVQAQPLRSLAPGERLIVEGDAGGELYVLQSGRLIVSRDGVDIASIVEPGALIGEMSVLLGIDHSATVRADRQSDIRVIDDAIGFLERTPLTPHPPLPPARPPPPAVPPQAQEAPNQAPAPLFAAVTYPPSPPPGSVTSA